MRKFWLATSIILWILLADLLGVWSGAVYHDSLMARSVAAEDFNGNPHQ